MAELWALTGAIWLKHLFFVLVYVYGEALLESLLVSVFVHIVASVCCRKEKSGCVVATRNKQLMGVSTFRAKHTLIAEESTTPSRRVQRQVLIKEISRP